MPKTKAKTSTTGHQDRFNVRKRQKIQPGKKSTVEDVNIPKKSSETELRLRKDPKTTADSSAKLPDAIATVSDPKRSEQLEILKQFDLDFQYGPCGGITRLERWNRAEKLQKHPPPAVKSLIEKHKDDVEYVQAIWHFFGMAI